jgi:hypothetical protein
MVAGKASWANRIAVSALGRLNCPKAAQIFVINLTAIRQCNSMIKHLLLRSAASKHRAHGV